MLEAVNSVLQNAPLLRASVEQTSTTDSFAVNPDRVQRVSQAPYLTPYYSIDVVNAAVTLQIRDPQSGKVLQSYPSETDLDVAQRDPSKAAQANLPQPLASASGVQAQAQAATAAPAPASDKPAPTGQQIAAFGNAATTVKNAGSSVSLLA